jgi:hypothetical protein
MANSFLHSFGLYILVRFNVSVIFRCVVCGYIFGAGSEKIMFCLVISLLFFRVGFLLSFPLRFCIGWCLVNFGAIWRSPWLGLMS